MSSRVQILGSNFGIRPASSRNDVGLLYQPQCSGSAYFIDLKKMESKVGYKYIAVGGWVFCSTMYHKPA